MKDIPAFEPVTATAVLAQKELPLVGDMPMNGRVQEALETVREELTDHLLFCDPTYRSINGPREGAPTKASTKQLERRYMESGDLQRQRSSYIDLLVSTGVPERVAEGQFDEDYEEITARLNGHKIHPSLARKLLKPLPPTVDEIDTAINTIVRLASDEKYASRNPDDVKILRDAVAALDRVQSKGCKLG